jgi:hypothetical protein
MSIRLMNEKTPTSARSSGTIECPSSVLLLGDHIFLTDGSEIRANGGNVFAGGGIRGKEWPTADYLVMGPEAKIFAGRNVVLWGNSVNAFYGEIYAPGGFVETSSPGWLAVEGKVDTAGGTWLLDPTTVTISTAANAGVTAGNLPPPPAAVPDPYTVPFPGPTANINNTALVNALGVNNVIVDASLGAGGLGTITVNGPVAWSSGFSLTLNAPGNVTVNSNVQHSVAATGGVFVTTGQNFVVQGTAAGISSIGSQNATTSITATGDATVQGVAGGLRAAQIGFYTADGATATGPISVSCANLTIRTGGSDRSGAQIGHGRINVLGASPITVGADVTVAAAGNISLINGGLNGFGIIGHGNGALPMGADQNGDIRVTCTGSMTFTGTNPGANSNLQIGLGINSPNPDNGPVLTGLVDVRVGGNLTIDGNGMIGHGGRFSQTSAQTLNGDIVLCCGGNVNLTQIGGAIYIGHFVPERGGFPLTSINGDYNISIAGDLNMTATQVGAGAGNVIIGYNDVVRDPALNVALDVSVCGNVTINAPNVGAGNSVAIGLRSADLAGSTSETNLLVRGDFIATNIGIGLFLGSNRFDFNFGVGGDLTLLQLSSNGFATSGPDGTTRVFAGGTIFGNSLGASTLFIGQTNLVGYQTQSLDVRAGGDIFWPNSFGATFTAPLNFEAGHSFASGEIWTSSGGQLTTLCGQPFGLDLLCGACGPLAADSPALTSTCGAFSLSPNGATNVNFTTSSTLNLSSQCFDCSGNPSILLIGTGAANDVTLTNPVGPVSLGPFNTVDVNQDITSTGAISISACDSLNINPGTDLTTANFPITLIADVDNTGVGNLNLLGGNITSNGGQICLLAGPGSFGCDGSNCLTGIAGLIPNATSSVNQTSGSVNSGSGQTIVVASGDVLIDGAATSIGTTTGLVSITSGNDLAINEDIISTGGSITTISAQNTAVNSALLSATAEIRMIAGNGLSLNGTANLTSAGPVTLVADNDFPFQPFIGAGTFSMDCTAQITSGAGSPVRIFTALQILNSICLAATINGFAIGDPLFAFGTGPLYQDTPYEVWCSYFSCPFPYSFSSLGFPFTVFYKDCLQLIVEQAMELADELLVNLHPYDEFPGWMARFWLAYDEAIEDWLANEPFMIRRRVLNFFNHPKSFTQLAPE